MARRRDKRKALRPAEVLSGRVRPDLAALIRLIHQVNPTGRDLSEERSRDAYATKSALQSLLIARFGDRLLARPDGEGVVSLVRRSTGQDAGHAVVSQLDEEAGLWIRRQDGLAELPDEGAGSTPPPSVAAPPPHDDPRAAGQAALEAWDYPLALQHFTEAHAVRPDDPEAAVALLGLLVDHLGQDEAALALADTLPRSQRGVPGVASPIALAAARAGREKLARSWGSALRGQAALAVEVELARRALAEGRFGPAARSIAVIADEDPAHQALAELTRALEALRAALPDADAEALQDLRATEDWESLIARATEVLSRFPESRRARAAQLRGEQGLRDRAAEQRLADGRAALERGDLDRAARLLRSLPKDDDRVRPLLERLRQAREQEAATRAAEAEAPVVLALRAAVDRPALAAWLALAADSRLRVGEVLGPDRPAELDWLDQMQGVARRPKPCIAAALALREAHDRATEEPRRAAELLERHRRELEGVRAASALARHLAQVRAQAEEAQARALLSQAIAHIAAGAPGLAVQLLGQHTPPPALETGWRAALEQAHQALRVQQLEQALAKATAGGHALAAWEAAGSLDALGIATTPSLAESRAAVVHAWGWEDCGGEDLSLADVELPFGEGSLARLDPAGRTSLFAITAGPWLHAWELDVETGRCLRAVSLRLPRDLELPSVSWTGGHWRIAATGGILDLDPGDLKPSAWTDLDWTQAGRDGELDDVIVTPDPRYLWASIWSGSRTSEVQVLDLAERRLVRRFEEPHSAIPLDGPIGPRMFLLSLRDVCAVRSPRGVLVPPRYVRLPGPCNGVVGDPRTDAGLLVATVAAASPLAGQEDPQELEWMPVDATGTPQPGLSLEGTNHEAMHRVAPCRDTGLIHVVAGVSGEAHLHRIDTTGPRPRLVDRVRVPEGTVLLNDGAFQRVVAVATGAAGPQFWDPAHAPPSPEETALGHKPALEGINPTHLWFTGEGVQDSLEVQDRCSAPAKAGDWAGTAAAVAQVPPPERGPALRHLEGLAMLAAGEHEEALAILVAQQPSPGRDNALDLATALFSPAGQEPPTDWGQVVRSMRLADSALAAGAWDRALTGLDRTALWSLHDLQLSARRALAWLRRGATGPTARFRCRRVLARFVAELGERSFAYSLPLGTGTFPPERIASLKAEAEAWLEGSVKDGSPSDRLP